MVSHSFPTVLLCFRGVCFWFGIVSLFIFIFHFHGEVPAHESLPQLIEKLGLRRESRAGALDLCLGRRARAVQGSSSRYLPTPCTAKHSANADFPQWSTKRIPMGKRLVEDCAYRYGLVRSFIFFYLLFGASVFLAHCVGRRLRGPLILGGEED